MLEHFKAAPLSSSFMLASIIGFLISVLYVWKVNKSFGFTFAIIFGVMLVASIISMSHAPVEEELALDHHVSKSGKKPARR
ncbi:hypothetical protein HY488_01080 [Candidatus Woesearchaeota archaeon]|nr:hypothetical protein [Candidatus Woesearchaeota archaeon]